MNKMHTTSQGKIISNIFWISTKENSFLVLIYIFIKYLAATKVNHQIVNKILLIITQLMSIDIEKIVIRI